MREDEVLRREAGHLRPLLSAAQSLAAKSLEMQISKLNPKRLEEVEFRVSSQFGDDGIIFFLLSKIQPKPKTFIEFGVQDYSEANTRYLLESKNWSGLIIDGDLRAMAKLRRQEIYWRQDLTAIGAFVTRENINQLFKQAGFEGELGLLSVDIDGVDYWVWEAINVVNPSVVVAEYNSLFGGQNAISVPYHPEFRRQEAHWSCLYWGASLAALDHLAELKGYSLVGCNSAGNNAYFVRNDCLGRVGLPRLSPEEAFVESKFRESRDQSGQFTFLRGDQRFGAISELEVVDVKTGITKPLSSLLPPSGKERGVIKN
ncbi:MAG: hypothetical protein EB101_07320 [Chitinophagia bacterium]|nr:hypothetical protein [Chitinophagia bacterium]